MNLFAPTGKGFGLNLLMTSAELSEALIKKILAKTELLTRIKKLWRHASSTKSKRSLNDSGQPSGRGDSTR